MKTDAEIAKAAGLTVAGVRYKRNRGWSDAEIMSGQVLNSTEDLVDAQRRKEVSLADLRELDLSKRRGELIPLIDVDVAWAALVTITRTGIAGMANACCDSLAAMTDPGEVRAYLIAEIDRRLIHLNEEFSEAARLAVVDGGEGDSAEDSADGDGMGGVEPAT